MSNTYHPGVSALIEALINNPDGIRTFAMRRLVNMGSDAVPALIHLLGDRRPEIQESAAIILTTQGKTVIPELIDAMKHCKDRKVCWGAAWVLATIGSEARAALPEVKIPGREIQPATASSSNAANAGVWSDAWLTKVRAKLADARQEVSYFLAAVQPA